MRGEVEFVIRESVWVQNAAALFAAMDEAGVPRDGFWQSPEGEWYTVATRTAPVRMVRQRIMRDTAPPAEADLARDEFGGRFPGAPGSKERIDAYRSFIERTGETIPLSPDDPDNPDAGRFGIVVIID